MTEKDIADRCWWPFRWHPWTKWEIVEVVVYRRSGNPYDSERQQRTCTRCQLVQTRPL